MKAKKVLTTVFVGGQPLKGPMKRPAPAKPYVPQKKKLCLQGFLL